MSIDPTIIAERHRGTLAELLGIRPSTLADRMKTLQVSRPTGENAPL